VKTVVQEAAHPAFNGEFASLRGQLRMPVRSGMITSKFGTKRGEGPSFKGLFIKASEGVEIEVVAAGRVIFADWLRGFGNLIIVDHGSQYISIYGNNQALFKRAGDTVKGGDAIASIGNSGGNEQSGLYFEMRYQGRAIDPSSWMNR
jgi:septal ring factor EnvC (AmiA/AmiB activator)